MSANSLEVQGISKGRNYFIDTNSVKHANDEYSEPVRREKLRIVKNHEEYTDNELVDLFVFERDNLALNEVFNRYYDKVKRLALKILADTDEAEEVVQEVFITLLQKMESFRGESKFSTWLYSITLNTTRMRLREKIRDRRSLSLDNDDYGKSIEGILSNDTNNKWLKTPEEININSEFMENLNKSLDMIPEKYREAFILRDINQYSNQEVAEQLGLSIPAVKSRVHRARRFLQTSFGEYYR